MQEGPLEDPLVLLSSSVTAEYAGAFMVDAAGEKERLRTCTCERKRFLGVGPPGNPQGVLQALHSEEKRELDAAEPG